MRREELQQQKIISESIMLTPDPNSRACFGKMYGFNVIVVAGASTIDGFDKTYWTIITGAKKKGTDEVLKKEDFSLLKKNNKSITRVYVSENRLEVVIAGGFTKNQREDNLVMGFYETLKFLQDSGYEGCCETSRTTGNLESVVLEGVFRVMNMDLYSAKVGDQHKLQNEVTQKNENILLGIVGAMLGAAIGGVAIYFSSKLGRIFVLAGMLLAFLTLYGYKRFAGKLTKKGILISAILAIISVYYANRLTWINEIVKYYNLSFDYANELFSTFLEQDGVEFYTDLALNYLVLGLGFVVTAFSVVASEKNKKISYRLG